MNLIVAGLGNVPVLAKEAAHVAAGGAHAEDARARQEMIQRLLLNGLDLECGRRAVTQAVKLAAFIDADEAEAGLAGIDVAVARTKIAVDAPVGFRFPPARFVESLGFLEDFQLRHASSFLRLLYALAEEGFARQSHCSVELDVSALALVAM